MRTVIDKSKVNTETLRKAHFTLGDKFQYRMGDTVHFKGTGNMKGGRHGYKYKIVQSSTRIRLIVNFFSPLIPINLFLKQLFSEQSNFDLHFNCFFSLFSSKEKFYKYFYIDLCGKMYIHIYTHVQFTLMFGVHSSRVIVICGLVSLTEDTHELDFDKLSCNYRFLQTDSQQGNVPKCGPPLLTLLRRRSLRGFGTKGLVVGSMEDTVGARAPLEVTEAT